MTARWRSVPALLACLLVCVLTACAAPGTGPWRLVWADEFDGAGVDLGRWSFETGGHGWGNHELQYYTDGANARVENGSLVIEARREDAGGRRFTSARLPK